MTNQENQRIIWLDDNPNSISKIVDRIHKTLPFKIEITTKSTRVLELIQNDGFRSLLIVDLLLEAFEDTGIATAKTAKAMVPLLPILAVTEHLPDYCREITLSLKDGTLDSVWEKDNLREEKQIKEFSKRISTLVRREFHIGKIVKMESDFTQIRLQTPKGDVYERFFETDFLMKSGINELGKRIEIAFEKKVYGTFGEVILQIARSRREIVDEEEIESAERIDLEAIREKFGSVIDDTDM